MKFFIPKFAQTINESFQIMWIHLEKGLLYHIDDKKTSMILEKNVAKSKVFRRNSSVNSIFQSFWGLAHTALLWPYSQAYVPIMLKHSNKNEVFSEITKFY